MHARVGDQRSCDFSEGAARARRGVRGAARMFLCENRKERTIAVHCVEARTIERGPHCRLTYML